MVTVEVVVMSSNQLLYLLRALLDIGFDFFVEVGDSASNVFL